MLRTYTASDSGHCSGLCIEGERKSTKCLGQKFHVRLKCEQRRHLKKIINPYPTNVENRVSS